MTIILVIYHLLFIHQVLKNLAISIDGFGDFARVIAECNNQKIKIKKKILFPNSLGVFYESMTQLAGFDKYGDEYKLMGLSAYGKPLLLYNFLKENCFDNSNFLKLNLDIYEFHKKNFSYKFQGQPNQNFLLNKNKIYDLLEKNKIDFSNKEEFNKNIASSTQKFLKNFYLKL